MPPKNDGKHYEGVFQEELESFYKKNIFIHRFQDTGDATARANGRGRRTGRRKTMVYLEAQPSDFLVTLEGQTAYVEVKDCNSKTSFPFSNITAGQIIAAKRQVAAKGMYLFVIHHKTTWYGVPAEVILGTTKRKSLPWKDLEQYKLKKLSDIKRYFNGKTRN